MVFGQLVLTNNNAQIVKVCNLERTHVTGSIVHSFATLTLQQQFTTIKKDFYSIYINPPEGCVIYNVKGKFNDKLTEFVVHKLEEPVFNGYYDKNANSDAISLTLGEIPSNTQVKIDITCTFTATLTSSNSFAFKIPADDSLLNTQFSSNIKINMLKQNLPKIHISEGSYKLINGNLIISPFMLQKQFQIRFDFSTEIESAAFSSQIDKFNYIGLSLHPTHLKTNTSLKQEIFLLIDCSGSMSGGKIKRAQSALVKFLNALPKNCYFNIIRFGSTFERMFELSVENNKANIEKSLKFASMLDADLGTTDIYSPLMFIIDEKPKKGFVRQVFALTDGEVEKGANVIAACTANRNIMRVFPFGIGDYVNHAFLKDLAKSTMGVAHFIGYDEDISNTVLLTLKTSQVAAVVNGEIHVEGVELFEISPHPIPSLFEDDITHVILRYEKEDANAADSILFNGEVGDFPYEETINVVKIGNLIDFQKLFAYHNIRDMEDKLINSRKPEESEMIRENIVRLSMQCSVVSSFTGMFTVINGVEQKLQNNDQQMDCYNQGQNKFVSPAQQFSFQHPHRQVCQQQMTQKQCWAQTAYEQRSPPMQQMAQNWGSFNNLTQQSQHYPPPPEYSSPSPPSLQTDHSYQFTPQQHLEQKSQSKSICHNTQQTQPKSKKQNPFVLIDNDQFSPSNKLDQFQNDPFVSDLIKKQRKDGSWNDFSLINNLIDSKNKNSTINEILSEFPEVGNEIKDLSIECIITLFVIGWLYSQRKNSYELYNEYVTKGLNYIRLQTNKDISDDMSKNFNITESIPWKFQIFYL